MSVQQIEVKNTGGAGALLYSVIPAVLAGAALMWLACYTGIIDWTRVQRVEGRMDARVGVHGELTKPVDLIIRPTTCVKVSRAFLDNGTLTSYVTNTCHESKDYWEIRWNEVAPDGTIVASGYTNHTENGRAGIDADDTLEITQELKEDSRTSKVIVWTSIK